MSRKTWALIAIHVLVAAGIGAFEARAAEPNPIVAIRLENPNGLGAPSLVRAQELATEMYERAGVTLRWNIDATPGRQQVVVCS